MRVVRTLQPGAKGTVMLAAEYGARLVCVRYRYDDSTKKRYTTVEVVVAEGEWEPIARPPGAKTPPAWVRIAWGEKELARRVKDAGGRWDAERKLWQLPAAGVRELRLEDRVVPDVSGV
ncbi:MAG: hypothetical protein ACYDA8_17255 [Deferrisomatales bacterium]